MDLRFERRPVARVPSGHGVDVSEAAVQAVVERIAAELGEPTVLVNNAGIIRDNLLQDGHQLGHVLDVQVGGRTRYWRNGGPPADAGVSLMGWHALPA